MTCEHIEKAKNKINNLIEGINDSNSTLYEKLEGYVEWEKVKEYLRGFGLESSVHMGRVLLCLGLEIDKFGMMTVNHDVLYNNLSEIFDELKNCDCRGKVYEDGIDNIYDELKNLYEKKLKEKVDKYNELVPVVKRLGEEVEYLEKERERLNRELRDLRNEKEDEIKGLKEDLEQEKREHQNDNTQHSDQRLGWERERGELQTESARKGEKIVGLENQVGRLELRLDQRKVEMRTLENQLTNLRLESGEKDSKLREKETELERKNEEIQRLKRWAELSQEELLKEKLRSEKENLELFAAKLGIDLEQIHGFSRYHERLFKAQKSHNQTNIETHENNIARVKQELSQKKKISIVNIQEICRKCQRIAELCFDSEQTQQKQIQMKDWKNINFNFTPELVQEWISHGFTHEQCRDWINTTSPWQQNRAIKEPTYYVWLRDIKKVNAEWVLNNGSEQELGQEFFKWFQEQQKQQYQAHQEQPTK